MDNKMEPSIGPGYMLIILHIKDMSRMGRDYLKVGQIMEILRQRGVRLIAINDGVDPQL